MRGVEKLNIHAQAAHMAVRVHMAQAQMNNEFVHFVITSNEKDWLVQPSKCLNFI